MNAKSTCQYIFSRGFNGMSVKNEIFVARSLYPAQQYPTMSCYGPYPTPMYWLTAGDFDYSLISCMTSLLAVCDA